MLNRQVEFTLDKDLFDDKLIPYLFARSTILTKEFKKAGFDITVRLFDSDSLVFGSPFGDLFILVMRVGDNGYHNHLMFITKIIHHSMSEQLVLNILRYVKTVLSIIIEEEKELAKTSKKLELEFINKLKLAFN